MNPIACVILAAGSSKRLGFNKLSLRIDGQPVIRKTVSLFLGVTERVVVVTGFEAEKIEEHLTGLPVSLASNPNHLEGMSSSVKAALPFVEDREGVLFHLGDKPLVTRETIERTLEAFKRGSHIALPVFNGARGHPVLIRRPLFVDEMRTLQGDMGLRQLLDRHREEITIVEGDEGAVLDIDRIEDIAELERRGFTIEKG